MSHADDIRTRALYGKLHRTIFNVCEWWGVSPMQATQVLGQIQSEISSTQQIDSQCWPDPERARYCPGTPDDELQVLAHQGALAIAAVGKLPSARNVWAYCKAQGARKRQAPALRLINGVLANLSAREVPASVVRVANEANSGTAKS